MDAWSIAKGVNGALRAVGMSTGPLGAVLASPIGVAVSATYSLKKWVDSENVKVFEAVKKREGCPHIAMLEGSPPTPNALLYLADHGGVAWRTSGSALYFWHKEKSFKPLLFSDALVRGPRGVKLVQSDSDFVSAISRPPSGYGCSECRSISAARQ